MKLTHLSNESIWSGLDAHARGERADLAGFLAHLGEVEDRRLHLRAAMPSLWAVCIRRYHLSKNETALRVAVTRLARRFPVILDGIARGDLNMTNVRLLADYLSPDNHDELLRAVHHKTKIEVQELIAARFPRPDGPTHIAPWDTVEPLSPERIEFRFTG